MASDLGYLIAALAAAWVGLFLYMYYLGQRVRELRRDVEGLEQDVAERAHATEQR
jgi:CcmD family protein